MGKLAKLLRATVKGEFILFLFMYVMLIYLSSHWNTFYCRTGIVDISDLLDLTPSSVLLANAMACPTSMSVLINPDLKPESLESPQPQLEAIDVNPKAPIDTPGPSREPTASPTVS